MEQSCRDESILQDVLKNLLECTSDKNEEIRHNVEIALTKIAEKRADEVLILLVEHRNTHQKLNGETTSLLFRLLKNILVSCNYNLKDETLHKITSLAIEELETSDYISASHNPAVDILIASGPHNCKLVMEALVDHTKKEAKTSHFMTMRAMGLLAMANVTPTAPFIKEILANILPHLNSIKQDYSKQAYAFAVGCFCENLLEISTNYNVNTEEIVEIDCKMEVSVLYDTLLNQWLSSSREPQFCADILQALASMYPLLPKEKIEQEISRLINIILSLCRRSVDRNSAIKFLAVVLKRNLELHSENLNLIADLIITNLFDFVCVSPDYEKPQTIKGHFEALRCYHLLATPYSKKIIEMLLIHLKDNNERERIKSLLVFTHLLNTVSECLEADLPCFAEMLKQMILVERSTKMRMTLVKVIIASAQKSLIKDDTFVWFLVRYSCRFYKSNIECGTAEENDVFAQTCQNSLFMLSSTIGTIDDLLKKELLNYFVNLDYTGASKVIIKCLLSLFTRNPSLQLESLEKSLDENASNSESEITETTPRIDVDKHSRRTSVACAQKNALIPDPENILVRCLALLGTFREIQRITDILNFLKVYSPHINVELQKFWDNKIPDLILLNEGGESFLDYLYEFIGDTIAFLNSIENKTLGIGIENTAEIKKTSERNITERLVSKMAAQLTLYPVNSSLLSREFFIPNLSSERGMLLKIIGISLSHVSNINFIETKIDLIISAAREEKLEKYAALSEYEHKLLDASKALGFVSRTHLQVIYKKLFHLIEKGDHKPHTGFLSNLHFMKDSAKESDVYKNNLLILQIYNCIIKEANPLEVLKDVDENIIEFLLKQLQLEAAKDLTIKKLILDSLLNICGLYIELKNFSYQIKSKNEILIQISSIPIEEPAFNNLPLFPVILKLATSLLKVEEYYSIEVNETTGLDTNDGADIWSLLQLSCENFFRCAQNLKTKTGSSEDDERNSYLAHYLNQALPELNNLVKIIIRTNHSSTTCLDDVISILESWIADKNSEVRVCCGHVINSSLEEYGKLRKSGFETAKFCRTGQLLGKIIPRCVDSDATVRKIYVNILQKVLEINCIYETSMISNNNIEWIEALKHIRKNIITNDPREIYQLAEKLANIIALSVWNFEHFEFCETLLNSINDPEQSSAIGASVVLKFFVQQKGAELFHVVPVLVKKVFQAIKSCTISRAKTSLLKGMVALTKHHPKSVCTEILAQFLIFDVFILEYWQTVTNDVELTNILLKNLLAVLSSLCLHESNKEGQQKVAASQPLAVIFALEELFSAKEIRNELKENFPEILSILLSSLAMYTDTTCPAIYSKQKQGTTNLNKSQTLTSGGKLKQGSVPKDDNKILSPFRILLEAFKALLINLEMQQIVTVLDLCPLSTSGANLEDFVRMLSPMAVSVITQFSTDPSSIEHIITALSPYVFCPNAEQRIASIGFYSEILPLKPHANISGIIVSHLCSALKDPNSTVRGLSLKGLAFIGNLAGNDVEKYANTAITALLKGIDDSNRDGLINNSLESMRSLSQIFQTLPARYVESFYVPLAIRIRPFFENPSVDIREAAVLLFGYLCESNIIFGKNNSINDITPDSSPTDYSLLEALTEQLFMNLFSLLLHMSESNSAIVKACKLTLRKVCTLLAAPNITEMVQENLLEKEQLDYDVFIINFAKLIGNELQDRVQDFIESCIPFLKSNWSEIRGNAAILIGILHNFISPNVRNEAVGHKVAVLLKDEDTVVRIKAVTALGYVFGDL